jgi:hypothetical protein
VILEPWDVNGCVPRVTSYDNLTLTAPMVDQGSGLLVQEQLEPEGEFVKSFSQLTPQFLLHGDFRGRGPHEIVAFAADGRSECLQLEGGMLVACH